MIVVDLGCADRGEWRSLEALADEYKPDLIYGFDPSPQLDTSITVVNGAPVKLERSAAWLYDGQIAFTDSYIQARVGTIGVGPITDTYTPGRIGTIGEGVDMVPCFDFCTWLKDLGETAVVLKIDVEGAEYGLVAKMIQEGCDKLLAELIIEWHDGVPEYASRLSCPVREWWM